MDRGLDPSMAAALGDGVIMPAFLAQLTLNSGTEYVWSGLGDLIWNGQTWKGLGDLAGLAEIAEASTVMAQGTSVSLSTEGFSEILIPDVPPPFTPPTGQAVAWSYPSAGSGGGSGGGSGLATADKTGGTINTYSTPSAWGNLWSGFSMPMLPAGAVVEGVYAVLRASSEITVAGYTAAAAGDSALLDTEAFSGGSFSSSLSGFGVPSSGTSYSGNLGALSSLADVSVAVKNWQTLHASGLSDFISTTFVGLAVYYTGPAMTVRSLLYEAMNDIRVGAPAKIWFGLLSQGSFIGAPYLIFSGTVDKPKVKQSPTAPSISIALENRLVNLSRPSNRKYTAADQRLYYPTDIGFNWVEILQEISLKEGQ